MKLYNDCLFVVIVGHLPDKKRERSSPGNTFKKAEIMDLHMEILGEIFSKQSPRVIQKLAFHPLNDSIICVLTNENLFKVYDIFASVEDPVRQWVILKEKSILSLNETKHKPEYEVTSFEFGSNISFGWQKFSVFFICQNGSLYLLCPFLIHNFSLENEFLENLELECDQLDDSEVFKNEQRQFIELLKKYQTEISEYYCRIAIPSIELDDILKPQIQG
jgi:hypothetical protein